MKNLLRNLSAFENSTAQDLLEYARMAGFVAVTLGAFMPDVASSISTIFSELGVVPSVASTQGS